MQFDKIESLKMAEKSSSWSDQFQALYERVSDTVLALEIGDDAAECHGVLIGLLCAVEDLACEQWLTKVLGENTQGETLPQRMNQSERQVMNAFFAYTRQQFEDEEFGFSLFLPDDEQQLESRVEAFVNWCRGFLFGLSLGGVPEPRELSDDVREVIDDLLEFTRLDIDGSDQGEEGESAYVELVEYVKVSALLVKTELHQRGRAFPGNNSIH